MNSVMSASSFNPPAPIRARPMSVRRLRKPSSFKSARSNGARRRHQHLDRHDHPVSIRARPRRATHSHRFTPWSIWFQSARARSARPGWLSSLVWVPLVSIRARPQRATCEQCPRPLLDSVSIRARGARPFVASRGSFLSRFQSARARGARLRYCNVWWLNVQARAFREPPVES